MNIKRLLKRAAALFRRLRQRHNMRALAAFQRQTQRNTARTIGIREWQGSIYIHINGVPLIRSLDLAESKKLLSLTDRMRRNACNYETQKYIDNHDTRRTAQNLH